MHGKSFVRKLAVFASLLIATGVALAEPDGWQSEADLSFAGASGNTDTLTLRSAVRTERAFNGNRLRLEASYRYGESDDVKDESRATAGLRNDWSPEDSALLYFGQLRYDFDEFRAWTHRASAHAGLGYKLLQNDTLTVTGRLGAGASREWDATEDVQPEGVVGLEADWRIDERQRLTAETTLFPELDDLPQHRWVTTVAWRMQVSRARGLSLSLGLENEYESETPPGIRHNDLKYFAGLTISF